MSADYQEQFKQEQFIYIGSTTTTSKKRFILECPNHHQFTIMPERWRLGSRCPICREQEKINHYRKIVEDAGYIFKGIVSCKGGPRLLTTCPKGHHYEALVTNWNKGHRCKQCYCTIWNIDKVKKSFEDQGYILLSKQFNKVSDYVEFICPNQHHHKIKFSSWLRGNRCGKCYRKQFDIEKVKQHLASENIVLNSTPKTHTDPMSVACLKCNYNWTTNYYHWKNKTKNSCPRCIGKAKWSIEELNDLLIKQNYKLISTEYKSSIDPLEMICPKQHQCFISWSNFQRGHRCGKCSHKISKPELEIVEIYQTKGFKIKQNDRKIISPKELDIVFQDQKIAIEYCGLYWHGNSQQHINNSYHYDKMKACNKKQFRLITIFEDEWLNNKQICLSRIDNILNISKHKIYARKCNVIKLNKKQAKQFLEKNHLQGQGTIAIAYGLEYNGQLVQVMTFGKPTRSHTTNNNKVLELKRLANLIDHTVVGGASKLFNYAIKYAEDQKYDKIKSYCDMRWGSGNLYKQLGFKLTNTTKYTPHYFKQLKRLRNQSFVNKNPIELGYSVIYDCGHQTWEYDLLF